MTNAYPEHTWWIPCLYVKKSALHGNGIFTKQKIKKGEKIMVWGGQLFKKNDYERARPPTIVPFDHRHYIGLPVSDDSESIDEYLNHSCDPNTWMTDQITMVARRDIEPDEEITLDWVMWNSDEWEISKSGKCFCSSKNCRKYITPTDWKIPELQKRYAGHFSPLVQEKIDADSK